MNEIDLLDNDAFFVVEAIKTLDPIGFDGELEALRHANERKDAPHLVLLLS